MARRNSAVQRAGRRAASRVGAWIARAGYLQKWLFLGVLIGIIAGGGAVVFYFALRHAIDLLVVGIGGYAPPPTASEPAIDGAAPITRGFGDYSRPWAIPLVVCGGAVVSASLIAWFAPAAEGHGTDAAIAAIHHNPRSIRVRTVLVKIVASAITIGSGGSGGREGPTAQISAGFGSLLARVFDLRPDDGRAALAVGVGSGIGAIFSAPLGGAVLAATVAYRNDFDHRVLVPGFISSITAYSVFGAVYGFDPIFGFVGRDYTFDHVGDLGWFAVIGVCAAIVGIAYAVVFRTAVRTFRRLERPAAWTHVAKAGLGGLLMGLLALAMPQVLGSGYGWAQEVLELRGILALPLWLVLLLPAAKILATALSIGSGGSGGLFGPGIVIGAFTGAAVWRLGDALGIAGVPDSPATFVIVGMMACFGAISRAPLAIMLMVAEMTSGYAIMVPTMIAVGIAYLIVRQAGQTMYTEQLGSRLDEYTTRVGAALPLLDRVRVADAMRAPRLVLDGDTRWDDALDAMRRAHVPGAPVVDDAGRFVGTVHADAVVTGVPEDAHTGAPAAVRTTVAAHADVSAGTVPDTANLDAALEALRAGDGWLPVLDAHRRVRGTVAAGDIVRAYRSAIRQDRRRFRDVGPHAGVVDATVHEGAELDGGTIAGDAVPRGVIVLGVVRDETTLAVTSSTGLQAGDVVTFLGDGDGLTRALRAAGE